MNNFYVYQLIDPSTNLPFYIGKGKNDRIFDHEKNTINGKLYNINRYLYYKINKILKSNKKIIYKKILNNVDELDALKYEIIEIRKYGRKNNKTGILCNMTNGGDGVVGYKPTKKVKQKISSKLKIYYKNNLQAKDRLVNRIKKYSSIGAKIASQINSKTFSFVTSNNKLVKITNLHNFCKINKLNPQKMWKLVHGFKNEYKGYKNIDYFNGGMKRKTNRLAIIKWHKENKKLFSNIMKSKYNYNLHCKNYSFLSPNNEIIDVFNLSDFCRRNKLIPSCMINVSKGRRKSHKGWKSLYL